VKRHFHKILNKATKAIFPKWGKSGRGFFIFTVHAMLSIAGYAKFTPCARSSARRGGFGNAPLTDTHKQQPNYKED
jgi:hypothetical protein